MDDTRATDEDQDQGTALTSEVMPPRGADERADFEHTPGHWRYELRRWLATLNPGRTGREYEKAVSYFFVTPGVPQEVAALSFDLLLAYRGALALRASDPARGTSRTPVSAVTPDARRGTLTSVTPTALIGGYDAGTGKSSASGADGNNTAITLLAPATVNIRLTALRQFLVHCSMMGVLGDLSPDRIRMALKRLSIERRRPYQVLAEAEWEEFLAAALFSDSEVTLDGKTPNSESQTAARPIGSPNSNKTPAGSITASTRHRDYALIALALATGLRAIELSLLNLGDLSREWFDGSEEWWLVLPDEKSKGQHGGRTLPLTLELVGTLMHYVRSTGRRWEDPADRATPLFLSRQSRTRKATLPGDPRKSGYRLSTVQIRRIVDRVEQRWLSSRAKVGTDGETAKRAAGETRVISPHALRHSTAVALLEGNTSAGRPPASVEHVRGWLGHLDIRTTQGYLAHLESRRHRRTLALGSAMLPTQAVSTDRMENGATHVSQEDAAQADEVTTPPANSHAAEHSGKGMEDTAT